MRPDGTWRMPEPCSDCPFNSSGPGLRLRRSLAGKRWFSILEGLKNDRHFICHKTGEETGDGSQLLCAGAIRWQERRGLSSQMQRWMERIDEFLKKGKEA